MTTKSLVKSLITNAIHSINDWANNAYTSGGADNTVNSTKTIQILKDTQLVNSVTKSVSKSTLTTLINKLVNIASTQDMFVDQNALSNVRKSLSKLIK